MWKYNIISQKKEAVQDSRVSLLDGAKLPAGAILVVEVEYTDQDKHSYIKTHRISKNVGLSYPATIEQIIQTELNEFVAKDTALQITEQEKAVDEYLATLPQ